MRLHSSYLFLGMLVVLLGASPEEGDVDATSLRLALFVFLLLPCLMLHALAHVLVAKKFGIYARFLEIHPLGETTQYYPSPKGYREVAIAVSGPVASLALAMILLMIGVASGRPIPATPDQFSNDPVVLLAVANLAIFLINLLPAFPLDGGRILRGLLAILLSPEKAARWTVAVGRFMALVAAIGGVFLPNPLLLLLGFFLFMGSVQVQAGLRQELALQGHKVAEAMMKTFESLAPQDTLGKARKLAMNGAQVDFPVVDAWGRVAGLLTWPRLVTAINRLGDSGAVLDAMIREVKEISPDLSMEEALAILQSSPNRPLLVTDQDHSLVGLMTLEKVGQWITMDALAPGGE